MYRYLNDQIVMGISTTGRSGSIRGANLRTMVSYLNYAQIHFASVAAFVAGWRSSLRW